MLPTVPYTEPTNANCVVWKVKEAILGQGQSPCIDLVFWKELS